MRVRKEVRVTGTHTTEIVCFSIVAGILVGIGFGPGAGILATIASVVPGYSAAKKRVEKEANQLIQDDFLEKDLLRTMKRTGKSTCTMKTELKNIYPNQPILGRILFGNRLTKETTYYFDE